MTHVGALHIRCRTCKAGRAVPVTSDIADPVEAVATSRVVFDQDAVNDFAAAHHGHAVTWSHEASGTTSDAA